jgi:hypothetical protein
MGSVGFVIDFILGGRLVGLRVRIPPGTWMFVLCDVEQTKKQSQDNQDKEISTEKVQRANRRRI